MLRLYVSNISFDSLLNVSHCSQTTNANLYLIVRIYLERYEPERLINGIGIYEYRTEEGISALPIQPWASEWQPWCQSFKRETERAFNDKLWLIPNHDWGVRVPRIAPTHIPNVRCCLRIDLCSDASNAHLNLRCLRPRDGHFHSSYMQREIHAGEVDGSDLWEGGQVVTAHELGHYLGLGHVNQRDPRCSSGDTNADICYGGTTYQRQDLMGAGNRIETWHARPWLRRISQHVYTNSPAFRVRWRPATQRPLPMPIPETSTSLTGPRDAGV